MNTQDERTQAFCELVENWEELQATPSYIERFADGREQFPETDISCQPLIQQVNHIFVSKE